MIRQWMVLEGIILLQLFGWTGGAFASSPESIEFYRPAVKNLPKAVASWRTSCLHFDMVPSAFSITRNGRTYIFVSVGVKPAGGYGVRISRIVRTVETGLTVHAVFTSHSGKAKRNANPQRPYDLVSVRDTGRVVSVIPEGPAAPPRIALLVGAPVLPAIVRESRAIKLFFPRPGQKVAKTFEAFGAALVFEGTVQMRLTTGKGNVLARTFTTAASALDWGCFRKELTVPDTLPASTPIRLELFTLDEERGGETNLVRTSLILR